MKTDNVTTQKIEAGNVTVTAVTVQCSTTHLKSFAVLADIPGGVEVKNKTAFLYLPIFTISYSAGYWRS